MDSWARFSETSLPDRQMFYSKLNDEHITEDEYAHAQTVWETFDCKTLGDYHDLYVKTDVALLADVFENFRNLCLEQYGRNAYVCYSFSTLLLSGLPLITDSFLHLKGLP